MRMNLVPSCCCSFPKPVSGSGRQQYLVELNLTSAILYLPRLSVVHRIILSDGNRSPALLRCYSVALHALAVERSWRRRRKEFKWWFGCVETDFIAATNLYRQMVSLGNH